MSMAFFSTMLAWIGWEVRRIQPVEPNQADQERVRLDQANEVQVPTTSSSGTIATTSREEQSSGPENSKGRETNDDGSELKKSGVETTKVEEKHGVGSIAAEQSARRELEAEYEQKLKVEMERQLKIQEVALELAVTSTEVRVDMGVRANRVLLGRFIADCMKLKDQAKQSSNAATEAIRAKELVVEQVLRLEQSSKTAREREDLALKREEDLTQEAKKLHARITTLQHEHESLRHEAEESLTAAKEAAEAKAFALKQKMEAEQEADSLRFKIKLNDQIYAKHLTRSSMATQFIDNTLQKIKETNPLYSLVSGPKARDIRGVTSRNDEVAKPTRVHSEKRSPNAKRDLGIAALESKRDESETVRARRADLEKEYQKLSEKVVRQGKDLEQRNAELINARIRIQELEEVETRLNISLTSEHDASRSVRIELERQVEELEAAKEACKSSELREIEDVSNTATQHEINQLRLQYSALETSWTEESGRLQQQIASANEKNENLQSDMQQLITTHEQEKQQSSFNLHTMYQQKLQAQQERFNESVNRTSDMELYKRQCMDHFKNQFDQSKQELEQKENRLIQYNKDLDKYKNDWERRVAEYDPAQDHQAAIHELKRQNQLLQQRFDAGIDNIPEIVKHKQHLVNHYKGEFESQLKAAVERSETKRNDAMSATIDLLRQEVQSLKIRAEESKTNDEILSDWKEMSDELFQERERAKSAAQEAAAEKEHLEQQIEMEKKIATGQARGLKTTLEIYRKKVEALKEQLKTLQEKVGDPKHQMNENQVKRKLAGSDERDLDNEEDDEGRQTKARRTDSTQDEVTPHPDSKGPQPGSIAAVQAASVSTLASDPAQSESSPRATTRPLNSGMQDSIDMKPENCPAQRLQTTTPPMVPISSWSGKTAQQIKGKLEKLRRDVGEYQLQWSKEGGGTIPPLDRVPKFGRDLDELITVWEPIRDEHNISIADLGRLGLPAMLKGVRDYPWRNELTSPIVIKMNELLSKMLPEIDGDTKMSTESDTEAES